MRTCCWALLLSLVLVLPVQRARNSRQHSRAPSRTPRASSPAPPSRSRVSTRGASQQLVTNSSGYFEAPLLQPGHLPGDGRDDRLQDADADRPRAGGRPAAEPRAHESKSAQVTETVTVTADTPLLDTSSVSSGQNFDSRMVEGLPMFSNMPIMLTRFAAGVNPSTNQSLVSQGFADGTTQAAGAAVGGVGSNNYSIDGATNSGSGRRIAASPNSDMIQEMRVESSNFDASVGHGTGLQISMMTRAGREPVPGHGELSVLDEQVQRAEPQPEADVHAGRQGALRVRPFAQHGADARRAGRDPEARQRPQQALLLRQLLVRQRLHSRQEPGRRARCRRARRSSTATSPICSGCRTRRSTRSTIRSRCAPIRRIRTGSSAIRSRTTSFRRTGS